MRGEKEDKPGDKIEKKENIGPGRNQEYVFFVTQDDDTESVAVIESTKKENGKDNPVSLKE